MKKHYIFMLYIIILTITIPFIVYSKNKVQDPIAVMPFKNINNNSKFSWLSTGIAETMISDLKGDNKLKVVERDQIDKALTEIALQGISETETSSAVKVGKITGAKTIVLGGFQMFKNKIRITARFVAVETGIILKSAKVTGKLTEIFNLQDQIVSYLIDSKKSKRNKHVYKRKMKTTKKSVEAYKMYSLSLNTSSGIERVKYLRASLKLDPEFSYAASDLKKLQDRLNIYDKKAEKHHDKVSAKKLALINNINMDPQIRSKEAVSLLSGYLTNFKYKKLLNNSEIIYNLKLPDYSNINIREYSSYCIFFSLYMLKKNDLALQMGEEYLKQFASGLYRSSIKMLLQNLISLKEKKFKGLSDAEEEIKKLNLERAEYLKKPRRKGLNKIKMASYDFQKCTILHRKLLYNKAIKSCGQFVKDYISKDDPTIKQLIITATYHKILSFYELGQFNQAKKEAKQMISNYPENSLSQALKTMMNTWPSE